MTEEPKRSNIHEIKRISLMDVPAKLRELADRIERENFRTCVVIVGHDNGQVCVRSFGERTDALQTTGWLHRALDAMTSGSYADTSDWPSPLPQGPAA